ncbi:hypothetical protein L226DRAFT_610632 [Lentinus tigrinus ALCF2SS1-7]|uniref:DUF7582 domain-containing protein n=1 Tax=Lentinus tigrinus ALCF2SS1-6 TaxID=1328759 RepID=A0A5C2S3Z6_9APHY|nr:hypothetical protein L227DRAFT_613600 [Lentinus tigrinus ALCF2SS1-6]RPD78799.1 hypothetical protein L226DRAFT_610632 [Lentinus tigrinus ALCF2SS1-7]
MGNCLSASDQASLRDLVLRPGTTSDTLTADELRRALTSVASTLHAKGSHISIVAVGGAVNTLYLHSRETTSDVDFFFHTKTKNDDVTRVIAAADVARKHLNLDPSWLNNHTAVFIQEETIRQLYDEAVQQGEVVFTAAGLTVYAAPWRYALAAKLARVAMPHRRDYDMSDAVAYLDRLVSKRSGGAVRKSEIQQWAAEFKFAIPSPDVVMQNLTTAYREAKGREGLVDG